MISLPISEKSIQEVFILLKSRKISFEEEEAFDNEHLSARYYISKISDELSFKIKTEKYPEFKIRKHICQFVNPKTYDILLRKEGGKILYDIFQEITAPTPIPKILKPELDTKSILSLMKLF